MATRIAKGGCLAYSKTLADISVRSLLRYLACGLALVALSDVPNNWAAFFLLAQAILAFLLFLTLLLPIRPAIILLLMLAIAGQDIVSSGNTSLNYSTASIWQLHVGPLNPSMIVFGVLFWRLFKIRKKTDLPPFVKWLILWLATVPVIAGLIYGGFFSGHAGVEVPQDLRFFLMPITTLILFLSILKRDPRYLTTMLAAFTGVLVARHFVDLIYVIANVGPVIAEGVSRGSTDSAKGGIVFLLFLGLVVVIIQKRLFLGILITIPSAFLLVSYGTRNIWITFVLGIFVLLMFIGVRRSIIFISLGTVLFMGGISSLQMLNPQSAEVVFNRSKDITEGRRADQFSVLVDYNILSRIDQIRYAQILNVFDSAGRRHAYLWGTGYGGYYEDLVAGFPRNLPSTYPQYSLDEGRYFMTHSFSTQMFLKYGVLGMILIYALWFIPIYKLFKIWQQRSMFTPDQPIILNSMILCIAAFIPTAMFQTTWSGKGLFINGLIIAATLEFSRHYSKSNKCINQRKALCEK